MFSHSRNTWTASHPCGVSCDSRGWNFERKTCRSDDRCAPSLRNDLLCVCALLTEALKQGDYRWGQWRRRISPSSLHIEHFNSSISLSSDSDNSDIVYLIAADIHLQNMTVSKGMRIILQQSNQSIKFTEESQYMYTVSRLGDSIWCDGFPHGIKMLLKWRKSSHRNYKCIAELPWELLLD